MSVSTQVHETIEQESSGDIECEPAVASESASVFISVKQPKKKGANRKYDNEYLKLGFYWTGEPHYPSPLCVVCYETLSNDAMKPSKLLRHFETKHAKLSGKQIEYFDNKLKVMLSTQKSMVFVAKGGEETKSTEASYKVALLVAKAGQSYTIGEKLVKPAAKLMTKIMLGEKAERVIDKIPLSNDTVQRRIKSMAYNVEEQLLSRVRDSKYFALQLDETTDVQSMNQLLAYVRYIYSGEVLDDFLFCLPLTTQATGEKIFDLVNDYIARHNVDWKGCVGVSTDGAPACYVRSDERNDYTC